MMTKFCGYKPCRVCGKRTYVSKRKLCRDCSLKIQAEEQEQLKRKKGDYYDKWRQGIFKAIERPTKGK